MPTMVFTMLDALDTEPGQRVLEIGTGTGWNAALLAHRFGADSVVSVEANPRTAEGHEIGWRSPLCTPRCTWGTEPSATTRMLRTIA
ncbi:protein-L-isoaspartate O-methyltransferase family protein [Streptomyces mayonensis]|uniref:protein-L-isoaspartate O-methyltransferase family protein n=1 Tax=Streptomyces mayonensis TaxID=2750816 RepID=UPI0027E3FF74|nr:hypothetical protein [Streptomyces sp. A108]